MKKLESSHLRGSVWHVGKDLKKAGCCVLQKFVVKMAAEVVIMKAVVKKFVGWRMLAPEFVIVLTKKTEKTMFL